MFAVAHAGAECGVVVPYPLVCQHRGPEGEHTALERADFVDFAAFRLSVEEEAVVVFFFPDAAPAVDSREAFFSERRFVHAELRGDFSAFGRRHPYFAGLAAAAAPAALALEVEAFVFPPEAHYLLTIPFFVAR